MKVYIVPQLISGMMVGIELIEGGLVLDLLILRIMFLRADSPYVEEMGIEDDRN
jgi:hypothetical protein